MGVHADREPMIDRDAPFTFLDPAVAAVLAVPQRQRPSEWAAEHRVLSGKDSAEPGKWSNLRAPYLVEPMDACGDPELGEVVVMKAAQVGMSEALRNVLGYWIANDPGPVLWVLPDETSGEEVMEERITPMVRDTPVLAAHLSTRKHHVSKHRILLDHMEIHAAHATSPQSLASRPRRYAVLDELDKYPAFSGKEASPVALAEKRLTTFGHRAKRVKLSTPTIRNRGVHAEWESCPVQLHYHVPCPLCGVFAVMAWTQIRWPAGLTGTRAEQGAAIEEGSLAWYVCASCKGRVEERHRAAMVARGVWADPRFERVEPDGRRVGNRPVSRKRGYHIPALISPWVPWSQMAGEFVAAIGDEGRMMDWRNSRLGEPYEVRAAAVKCDALEEKARAPHRAGVVPRWAGMLLATADTQKDGFWYVVRAWGFGFRSRLVAYGQAATFAELREKCLDTHYPSEEASFAALAPHLLLIDSGGAMEDASSDMNRTDQVYQFALSDPARIFAAKGWGGSRELEVPIRPAFIADKKVTLYHLKTGYFKDVLASRIGNAAGDADSWELNELAGADYRRQMASEHKVLMRGRGGVVARWVPISAGAANHLWDCEAYQIAASQIAHVEALLPEGDLVATRARPAALEREDDRRGWDSAVGELG